MKVLPRVFAILFVLQLLSQSSFSQSPLRTDTTMIFKPSNPDFIKKSNFQPLVDAWGLDLLISNNGFGAGAFYRHEYTDDLSMLLSFAISDVKDDAEVEQFTYYGTSFVPGKKNRLLLFPLTAGIQLRLFKDDIVDNFRPYISVGGGPSMIFVSPYAEVHQVDVPGGGTLSTTDQIDFFSSLKYGKAHYTVGAYIGGGAYFGLDKGSLSGVSFRYYFVPFPQGIEVLEGATVKEFGGFYITLNFGALY